MTRQPHKKITQTRIRKLPVAVAALPEAGVPGLPGLPGPGVRMPTKAVLVKEAIARLDTAGLRSQLLVLDTPTLEDLGLRLADRDMTVAAAIAWLDQELGDDSSVDRNAVYRFAQHFRRIYGQVRSEHCRRIARLSVSAATGENVQQMTSVALSRLTELVAERLVETDNLEQLTGTEISAAIATLDNVAKAEFKKQELALRTAEAEGKARKLEAELARLNEQVAAMRAENERRTQAAVKVRQEAVQVAKENGGQVSRKELLRLLDQAIRGEAA